jgi:hypothetical protein
MARTKEQDRARKAAKKAAANDIGTLPRVKNRARRDACRGSLALFLKTYCMGTGGFLKTAPSERMGEIIEHLQAVVQGGGRTHIRMARAHGKTCFLKGACLYALVYGFRRFIVAVAARKADASAMIEDIFTLCEDGETFAADFPEIAVPIRKLGGIMQRAQNQTHKGKRTKIGKTAERIVLPTIAGSAASGAVLVARGFKGAARGLVRGSMRPDLVLFDDLQDDKAAHNPRTVQQYDEMIEKNFLGLGGHDKQIAAFMTSTPICPDDLSETYAAKTNWKTFTFPMMVSHPDCWGMPGDKWQQYFRIRQDSISAGEPEHERANVFYAANRAEMDAGADVLNPDFYDHETELSGIQHAMNLRFANGEDSFQAEYQMHPVREHDVFRISAPLIVSRVRKGTAAFHKPPETVFTACATDLNPAYGFTTCIVCFDKAQTAFIPWYHVFTGDPLPIREDIPERTRAQLLVQALAAHGREIAGWCRAHGFGINCWGVDAGGKQWESVCNFAASGRAGTSIAMRSCGIGCVPMVGRAGRAWNPNVKSRIADERNGTVMCADTPKGWRWLAFNADVWRETAQKAWLGEVGTPGGLSLFDGNGTRHADFAGQIAGEILEYKVTLQDGRTDYHWRTIGRKHDFGDAVTMCYALAGQFGISAGGYKPRKKKRRRTVYCV